VWKVEDIDVYRAIFNGFKDCFSKFDLPVYAPTVLMADGAKPITNAANEMWPGIQRLMCYFHLQQAVKKHGVPCGLLNQVQTDIRHLQRAPNPQIFDHAANLLVSHWSSDPRLLEFVGYFERTWLQDPDRRLWYEGAAPLLPSTNNGLEGTNARIKADWLNHSQETMAAFLP
jgi:hypothetical protein